MSGDCSGSVRHGIFLMPEMKIPFSVPMSLILSFVCLLFASKVIKEAIDLYSDRLRRYAYAAKNP